MDLLYHHYPSARLRCCGVENLAISAAHAPSRESSRHQYGLDRPPPTRAACDLLTDLITGCVDDDRDLL